MLLEEVMLKAMLVECCFVDTDDADEYKSIGAKKMASAICKGITGQVGNEDDDMKNYDEIINEMGRRNCIFERGGENFKKSDDL